MAGRNLGASLSYLEGHATESRETWNSFYESYLRQHVSTVCDVSQHFYTRAKPHINDAVHWATRQSKSVHEAVKPTLETHVNSIRQSIKRMVVEMAMAMDILRDGDGDGF